MKICLTGATGFVGSSLVKNLVEANMEVVVLTRDKGNTIPNVQSVEIDSERISSLEIKSLKNCETLIHIAAETKASKF